MSVAEISEQLNLTSIKDHGWHIQVEYNCIAFITSVFLSFWRERFNLIFTFLSVLDKN